MSREQNWVQYSWLYRMDASRMVVELSKISERNVHSSGRRYTRSSLILSFLFFFFFSLILLTLPRKRGKTRVRVRRNNRILEKIFSFKKIHRASKYSFNCLKLFHRVLFRSIWDSFSVINHHHFFFASISSFLLFFPPFNYIHFTFQFPETPISVENFH